MDFEGALRFVETYSREYLLYLLDFFRRKRGDATTQVEPPEGKVVVYAMISAAIGLFLGYRFVTETTLTAEAFAIELFVKFAYWLAVALVLHLMLTATRARTDFMIALLATLTVLPVAYALGGYGAYVMRQLSWLWTPQTGAPPIELIKAANARTIYLGSALCQLTIALIYFPRVLSRTPGLARWRVAVASVGVSLLLILAQVAAYIRNFGVISH